MKKAIIRGIILGFCIVLISLLGMGVIDIVVFGIIALLVLILACLATIIHNQNAK